MDKESRLGLNDGREMPAVGFGTWQLNDGSQVRTAVAAALETGYRLIDTAKIYDNEEGVGVAVNGSGIPRDEIFITTKLWNSDHGYDNATEAFQHSLERLAMNWVDLYLIHWPGRDNVGSWKALIDINKKGGAKSIGVSNFNPEQLDEIIEATGVVPAVNQIEFNTSVYPLQVKTLEYCRQNKIVVEAYSPLSMGKLESTTLDEIAGRYSKSNAQIVLRWAVQHGTVPLPRSAQPSHIKENIEIFDFELSQDDMETINNIGAGKSALPF